MSKMEWAFDFPDDIKRTALDNAKIWLDTEDEGKAIWLAHNFASSIYEERRRCAAIARTTPIHGISNAKDWQTQEIFGVGALRQSEAIANAILEGAARDTE